MEQNPIAALLALTVALVLTFAGKMPRIRTVLTLYGVWALAGKVKEIVASIVQFCWGWVDSFAPAWLGGSLTGCAIIGLAFLLILMLIPSGKYGIPAGNISVGIAVLLPLLYLGFPDAAATVWNSVSSSIGSGGA